MGRIILVLTGACLVATFMIISNSSFKTVTTSAPPKNEDVSKRPQNGRASRREQDSHAKTAKKAGVNKSQRDKPNNSDEGSVGGVVAEEEQKGQDPAHAIVKGDSTPVYLVNSRDSSILWLLKKGDKVATDVEVTDRQGRWAIVKKGELTRPGFVLDENLQRANSPKENTNGKQRIANKD